jgi:hypothetical protein
VEVGGTSGMANVLDEGAGVADGEGGILELGRVVKCC